MSRTPRIPVAALAVLGIFALPAACEQSTHGPAHAWVAARISTAPAAFPLHVVPGARFPTDSAGKPFLLQGDNPSSIEVMLTPTQVAHYLDERKTQGFNTILFELIEHKFTTRAPEDVYGDAPFTGRLPNANGSACTNGVTGARSSCWDFSAPNDAYWRHVDLVIEAATARGFLVMVFPAYIGYHGGSEGWYQDMLANGPSRLTQYGRFLATRYRGYRNLIWVEGGDFIPPRREVVRAVAEGIRSVLPQALQTAHTSRRYAANDVWSGEDWFNLNDIYTGYDVIDAARAQRGRAGVPFFLIEAVYENPTPLFPDNEHANEAQVRSQAYEALLGGAFGQIMGNNPVWYFGPGWQRALNSPGAQSMAHLHDLMAPHAWWLLQPDDGGLLASAGALGRVIDSIAASEVTATSGSPTVPVASVASDRSFALIYCPAAQPMRVRLSRLAGPWIRSRWFDPSSGNFTPAASGLDSASGTATFRAPGRNAHGYEDWVLLLESVSGHSY